MDISAALNAFIDYLKLKNITDNTIKRYLVDLNTFVDFLNTAGIEQINQVELAHIQQYLSEKFYLMNRFGRQNSERTRNAEITAIRSFFRFLFEKEHIFDNLEPLITYVKEPKLRLPRVILNKRELMKLFKLPNTATTLGYRDRLMLELLYATGIRREELANIQVSHLNLQQKTILIAQGKYRKDRVVPFNKVTLNYLNYYLSDVRSQLLKKETDYLLLTFHGNKLHKDDVGQIIGRYIKQANFSKPVKVHTFRHTVSN